MYPRLAQLGPVTLPTYGFVAALGLVCSILFAEWCAHRAGVSQERIWNLSVATALGTLLLSRLVLVAQSPVAFRTYPWLLLSLPTVTRFGLLLALASAAGSITLQHMPWLRTLDAVAPAALLFSAFLHLGSLFAGTDIGSATTAPIGRLIPGNDGHHPVALYATVAALLATAVCVAVLITQQVPGRAFGAALSLAAVSTFFTDQFRPAYALPQAAIAGFLHVDQLLLILITAAGMLLLLDRKGTYA